MNRKIPRKPTQQQFVLPLLDCMENHGGKATPQDVYDGVATKLGVADEHRHEQILIAGKAVNTFERSCRWSMQKAKAMGLIAPVGRHAWELTGKGKDALHRATPGIVITVFTTADGIALFGRAEDAVAHIDDGSISLVFGSPPYPLLREKQYGNLAANQYIDWLLRIADTWPRKMTSNGSVVLNLGDAYNRGEPSLSLYQERLLIRLEDELGWKLCQRFAWHNPSKMPTPAEWVTVRRVRLKSSLEQIYWLAPKEMPYADNRAVQVPYSEAMKARIAAGGEARRNRPSGHKLAAGAFATDNGGAIANNLLIAANTSSNDSYQRLCRERGLPPHPARFPAELPEFFLKLCTRPGETTFDPFSGSFQTGAVAERLGRKWIGTEIHLEYILGGATRFPNAAFQQAHLLERFEQSRGMTHAPL
ncbi:MAG: DNA methylase [Candidimonas sp.]|nr:MAG: DNA methylase [Candidimonas sp.]